MTPGEDLIIPLLADIRYLKSQLHRADIRHRIKHINFSIRRKEALAATGRLKRVIRSIRQTQSQHPDLTAVKGPEGMLTDPEAIHNFLSADYERCMTHPTHSHLINHGLEEPQMASTEKWDLILESEDAFVELFRHSTNFPIPHLIELQ